MVRNTSKIVSHVLSTIISSMPWVEGVNLGSPILTMVSKVDMATVQACTTFSLLAVVAAVEEVEEVEEVEGAGG